ncbi:protein dpy-30 homolog [Drosophila innubila]|uniref:protein dpy-30 homolog n=1 Tax=Drosophila innubila TaxID=198719 RepID=UPI00148D8DEA|nr:protein dpy-30 homolog [Drosophila innubila]
MSNKKQETLNEKKKNKNWVMCCPKDLKKPPKPVQKPLPPIKTVKCPRIEKPPKQPKQEDEVKCEQTKYYRSAAEQRQHLEKEVVPILMQGMLEVAREQPKDPISYLEKYWLNKQHKCDIKLPDDLL